MTYPYLRRSSVFLSARNLNRLYRYALPRESWNMTIERLLDEVEESRAALAKVGESGGDEESDDAMRR